MTSLVVIAVCASFFVSCMGHTPGCNPCGPGTILETGGSFHCKCPPRFSGIYCQDEVDPCSPNPCRNSGVCSSSGGNHWCTCQSGWTGRYCQTPDDPCVPSPCLNSALCSSSGEAYWCNCKPGWTGRHCQTPDDPCTPDPCHNGVCSSSGGTPQCTCSPGWTGIHCDTPSASDCVDATGGTCAGLPDGDYQLCDTCIQFAACVSGELKAMPCAASTVWDDNLKRCEATSSTCSPGFGREP